MSPKHDPKFKSEDIRSLTLVSGTCLRDSSNDIVGYTDGSLQFETQKGDFEYEFPFVFNKLKYVFEKGRHTNGIALSSYLKKGDVRDFIETNVKFSHDSLNCIPFWSHAGIDDYLRQGVEYEHDYWKDLAEKESQITHSLERETSYRDVFESKLENISRLREEKEFYKQNFQRIKKVVPKGLQELILDSDFDIKYIRMYGGSISIGPVSISNLVFSFDREYFPVQVVSDKKRSRDK